VLFIFVFLNAMILLLFRLQKKNTVGFFGIVYMPLFALMKKMRFLMLCIYSYSMKSLLPCK